MPDCLSCKSDIWACEVCDEGSCFTSTIIVHPEKSFPSKVTRKTQPEIIHVIRPVRQRLDGFNQFLFDVYGDTVWLSTILKKHKFPESQTKRIRENHNRLSQFLQKLRNRLISHLDEQGYSESQILSRWYGLGDEESPTAGWISLISDYYSQLMSYFRSEAGRKALDGHILATAREMNR